MIAEMAAISLSDVRIGFACKQRWEDMAGDDRVRACSGCDRLVFNLSAMTREEAEAVLATRGVTPCVRFYRRADGTVMTADCPAGTPRARRRLAVVASSLATGTTLAAVPPAMAEPPQPESAASQADDDVEMGVISITPDPRAAVEWSTWGRLGAGIASPQPPSVVARAVTVSVPESPAAWELAAGADLTLRVAADGDIRVGAWGEVRTSSDAVAGGELVVEGLPPHPYESRIAGSGSLVVRAGGNSHVVTAALGLGYVGSWPRDDAWVPWARHVVGARVVASLNRSRDDPREWSATVGVEIEPIGVMHAVFDLVTGR